jgi:kynurenine formamidase
MELQFIVAGNRRATWARCSQAQGDTNGRVETMPESKKKSSSRNIKVSKQAVDEAFKALSNWGRWGKDDQLGALNLITPQKRRDAARLVHDGVSVSLAHNAVKDVAEKSQAFGHRMVSTGLNDSADSAADVYSVQYHGYFQTHLDALCHLFYKGKMFNGISQREVTESGAGKLSVTMMRDGLFTRGILMDIPKLTRVAYLPGKKAIYPEDLDAWEKRAGIRVGPGDAILVRTGRWARRAAHGDWNFEQDSAGLYLTCLRWLKSRDVSVLGSDLASDVMPSGVEGPKLPVHWGAIWSMGVPILDNLDLERLSETATRQNRWEFLLTAAPLAVDGGTGSPINPIATY